MSKVLDESPTVGSVLNRVAAQWGDRTAIRAGDAQYSFAELKQRAERAAGALAGLGLGRGDRVAAMLPNCIEFVDVFTGAAISGVVQVPINTEYRGQMLQSILERCGASVLIIDDEYRPRLQDITLPDGLRVVPGTGSSSTGQPSFVELCRQATPVAARPDIGESDPVAIMYTSGTTGPSKGALITQRHAYEYAGGVAELLEIGPEDVYYAALPLFHIAGQWAVVYASVQRGARAILKRHFSVSTFWDDCAEHGVTVTFLLGAMAQFLYNTSGESANPNRSLDRILMVPLVPELAQFKQRFGVRVTTCYGSTETNIPIRGDFTVDDPHVAGMRAPGYQLRVADENDVEVPDGQVGELLVRPDVPWRTMVEYSGDSDTTAAAFRNLWLHSGDLFRRDGAGRYYFVDRNDDALRRRGENISSFEVEREVYAHPDVVECAAVAAPSEATEDEVRVFVVARAGSGLDQQTLLEFLEPRTPKFMMPRYVDIVSELPKTPTGKIQKHLLRSRPLS